jgi:hypothetical protein
MKKILLFLFFTVITMIVVVPPAYAQGKDWGGCVDPDTKVATLKCIPVVFGNLISAALEFVGTVAVFLIVYAGITFVRSGGDPKQVAAAQKIVTYAIIGLVVVLSSFAIIYFISYTTGVKCITNLALNCG